MQSTYRQRRVYETTNLWNVRAFCENLAIDENWKVAAPEGVNSLAALGCSIQRRDVPCVDAHAAEGIRQSVNMRQVYAEHQSRPSLA